LSDHELLFAGETENSTDQGLKKPTVALNSKGNKMTTRSTRSKAVKETVKETIKEVLEIADISEPKNKRLKKSVNVIKPAILPLKTQNSIIRTVLDRLDGKSVILHGIDRTKS